MRVKRQWLRKRKCVLSLPEHQLYPRAEGYYFKILGNTVCEYHKEIERTQAQKKSVEAKG